MPDSILILTCGTGTAGKHSNLAAGLKRSVELLQPRALLLVPSAHSDSQAIADLVREAFPRLEHIRRSDSEQIRIEDPDDLFICRETIRRALQTVRPHLHSGERLVINPTSGTKQMSVGAALAALDEELGEIVFTVGERADGVVRTGSERIATFQTRRFLYERTLAQAEALFQAGACLAAARVLEPYRDIAEDTCETALCLHHWQHLHYQEARKIAAASNADTLVRLRRLFDELCKEPEPGGKRLADLAAGAERLYRWGMRDEALVRYYHVVEATARLRLTEHYDHLKPPYPLDALLAIPDIPRDFARRLKANSRDQTVHLTLHTLFEVLNALDDDEARAYFDDRDFQDLLRRRNDYVHAGRASPAEAVERLRQRTLTFLKNAAPQALLHTECTQLWPVNISPPAALD